MVNSQRGGVCATQRGSPPQWTGPGVKWEIKSPETCSPSKQLLSGWESARSRQPGCWLNTNSISFLHLKKQSGQLNVMNSLIFRAGKREVAYKRLHWQRMCNIFPFLFYYYLLMWISASIKDFTLLMRKVGQEDFFFLVYLCLWLCEFAALQLAAQEQSQWCFTALCCHSDIQSSAPLAISSLFSVYLLCIRIYRERESKVL